MNGAARWEGIGDGIHRFRDSCVVYAVQGPEGTLLINAGTGRCVDSLGEVAKGPVTVLLTHHFRDHTDGAIALAGTGARILAPIWEREYLTDPAQHFRERQTWNSYDNRWDRFAPVRPIPVAEWLYDWDRKKIAGLDVEVVPAPGASQGGMAYLVTREGRRLAFTGETISGPGSVPRLSPFQYDYNDLNGAINVWHTCRRLSKARPDRLLPSLGEPMDDALAALNSLRAALKTLDRIQPGFAERLRDPDADDVEEVLPRLWRSRYASAETHFVAGQQGRVLSLDYGYNWHEYEAPQKQHRSNRRPFLHGLDGIEKRTGQRRIDTVLVSHYHDDHVNGIAMLQRLFGTEVWAPDHVADILERPERYDLPCLWHEPIRVARRLKPGEQVEWDGVPIVTWPMSGHTRYASLLCLTVGAVRVAHTGDQMFFHGAPANELFGPGARLFTNHVYKNGLDAGCYRDYLVRLRAFNPAWILTGHTRPHQVVPELDAEIARAAVAFDEVHETVGGAPSDGIHFGFEGRGGELRPYRVSMSGAGTADLEGWIMNPFPRSARAVARLVLPPGWEGGAVEADLQPRERREIRLNLRAPAGTVCIRQPIALDLEVDGVPFGQVAEALVTTA